MATANGLEPFTMYLDPNDPEDAQIIRYLKPKIKRKKVSGELREAMLVYLEYLRNGNLAPTARHIASTLMPEYESPRQLAPPVPAESGGTKALQEARKSFMKR